MCPGSPRSLASSVVSPHFSSFGPPPLGALFFSPFELDELPGAWEPPARRFPGRRFGPYALFICGPMAGRFLDRFLGECPGSPRSLASSVVPPHFSSFGPPPLGALFFSPFELDELLISCRLLPQQHLGSAVQSQHRRAAGQQVQRGSTEWTAVIEDFDCHGGRLLPWAGQADGTSSSPAPLLLLFCVLE